jgi:hypothetical protein
MAKQLSEQELRQQAVRALTERLGPVGEKEVEQIEGKIANRCIDILVKQGIFICSAVYD